MIFKLFNKIKNSFAPSTANMRLLNISNAIDNIVYYCDRIDLVKENSSVLTSVGIYYIYDFILNYINEIGFDIFLDNIIADYPEVLPKLEYLISKEFPQYIDKVRKILLLR